MDDLPRALLCCFDALPAPTALSRRITTYVQALEGRFSVVVLARQGGDQRHLEVFHGARLLRVPVAQRDPELQRKSFERAVRRQLESEEYALVHVTDPVSGFPVCELRDRLGYRVVYEATRLPSIQLPYLHPRADAAEIDQLRQQELFCLSHADRVLTGSEVMRRYLEGCGIAPERSQVLRAPVELGPYQPDVVGRPDGVPMSAVYVGSALGYQGVSTLLEAMAITGPASKIRLSIVGPLKHAEWMPRLSELRLEGRVQIHETVEHEELHKLLATADVGVVPLAPDERNRHVGGELAKASEYLAGGRPVIASDLPVCRELLPEGAALFHAAGDAPALAASLLELSRDPVRRVAMGEVGRQHARAYLDAKRVGEQLVLLYDQLLALPLSR